MRHNKRNQRLSRPTDQRAAMVGSLVKNLITHGEIRTTWARAKEASRVADRLVSLGKDGSIHARRQAYRVLQDRVLVGQLFTNIAPRFGDVAGGYTRVMRLGLRPGDGAELALLSFSRLPARQPAPAAPAAKGPVPKGPSAPASTTPAEETPAAGKPKGFLEGLRGLWTKKKKAGAVPA